MPPTYSLVIPLFNQLAYTRACVDSILAHSQDFELILVDNGSTDGTTSYLHALAAQQPHVRLVLNQKNRGFGPACNQGMAAAQGRFVIVINNDTVVPPDWLDRIGSALESPGVGMVGPRGHRVAGIQNVHPISYDPRTLEGFDAFAREWSERHRNQAWFVDRLMGFCFGMRREVLDRVGGFDPIFGIGGFEDDDYCMRVQLAGFRLLMIDDVLIHHHSHATFDGEGIPIEDWSARNWEIFKEKWDIPQDHPEQLDYDRPSILEGAFDPQRHAVPLFAPRVRSHKNERFTVLVASEEGPSREAALASCEEAFGAGEATVRVLEVPSNPMDLPEALRQADLILGGPEITASARDMGLPALETPTPEQLQILRAWVDRFDWEAPPVLLDAKTTERWILGQASGWEEKLEAFCYLRELQPGWDLSLVIRTDSREEAAEIEASLAERGADPKQVAWVRTIVAPDLLGACRVGTGWIASGDEVIHVVAAAAGLPAIRLDLAALREAFGTYQAALGT